MQGTDSALARLFLVRTVNLPCSADRLISFQFTSKGRVTCTEVRGPLGGPRDQDGGWAYSKCLYLLSLSAALIVVRKCFQIKKPDWYGGLINQIILVIICETGSKLTRALGSV